MKTKEERRAYKREWQRARRHALATRGIGAEIDLTSMAPRPVTKFSFKGMKYADLFADEFKICQGKRYKEYVAEREAKTASAKKVRLDQLKAERAERIKKSGRLRLPKIIFNSVLGG